MSKDTFDIASVVGIPFDQASDLVKKNGMQVRVVEEDGVANMVTMEVSNERVNFVLVKQMVVNAFVG